MVCATSLTNDSFCGSMVSGSEPVLVVISPAGSMASAAAVAAPDGLVVPGVLVQAVAMSPAIMSRDRSDQSVLLRRMHASFLLVRLGTVILLRGWSAVGGSGAYVSERSRLPPSLPCRPDAGRHASGAILWSRARVTPTDDGTRDAWRLFGPLPNGRPAGSGRPKAPFRHVPGERRVPRRGLYAPQRPRGDVHP